MISSRIARAVGVTSLGVLVYMSPVDSTEAASHCGPKGTVNAAGTCDCDKCSSSVGASGNAHCAPLQKPPAGCKAAPLPTTATCGVAGKPACLPSANVVPLDYGNMISIKGGSFTEGSSDSKDYDAGPTHTVTVGDFKIDKYEVPVAEYAKCVAANKCASPPKDLESIVPVGNRCNWATNRKAHPMNCVSWTESSAYCAFKSKRLPTEAEWEYAAKGGSKNNAYPWGAGEPNCKLANYTGGASGVNGCGDGTAAIGTHVGGASAFGVQDLAGNVEEWTLDFWGTFSGLSPNAPNPLGTKTALSSGRHTAKGGSWDLSSAADMHAVHREPVDESTRMNWLGFRCATGPSPSPAPEMFKKEDVTPKPPTPPPIPPPPAAPNVTPPGDLGAMVKVNGGTFQMGFDADTLSSPVHAATLASYEIDKYEVSVGQYKQCVDKGQCAPPLLLMVTQNCNYTVPGRDNHPVNCVEWSDAKRYCSAMGKRLPTEAEWEYAARGPTSRPYPWGSNEPTCAYAAFSPANKQKCAASTQVVGTHPLGVSYFGAMDMGGNVEEWVYDYFADYGGGPANNPQGPVNNENGEHVVRGGNFNADAFTLHSYGRWHQAVATDWVGFRCAKN